MHILVDKDPDDGSADGGNWQVEEKASRVWENCGGSLKNNRKRKNIKEKMNFSSLILMK